MSDPVYDQAWITFRSHVRFLRMAERLWLLLLVFVIGGAIVLAALNAKGGGFIGSAILLFLIGLVVAVRTIADVRLKTFHCPRCERPFVPLQLLQRSPLYTIDHRFPCQHCGLPVDAVSANVDRFVAVPDAQYASMPSRRVDHMPLLKPVTEIERKARLAESIEIEIAERHREKKQKRDGSSLQ